MLLLINVVMKYEEAFNKYFLPKITSEKYNVEIDGGNFYDQAINDSIK